MWAPQDPGSICQENSIVVQRLGAKGRPASLALPKLCLRPTGSGKPTLNIAKATAALRLLRVRGEGSGRRHVVAFPEKPTCFFPPGNQAGNRKEMGMWGAEREGREDSQGSGCSFPQCFPFLSGEGSPLARTEVWAVAGAGTLEPACRTRKALWPWAWVQQSQASSSQPQQDFFLAAQ